MPKRVIKIYYKGELLKMVIPAQSDNLEDLREHVIRNISVSIVEQKTLAEELGIDN